MSALSLVQPGPTGAIASVPEIIDELSNGRIVVLVDDEDRENEGDLVFAADFVTPEKINFMTKHARGLVCLTLTEAHAKQLALPPMARANGTLHGTNFTASIEVKRKGEVRRGKLYYLRGRSGKSARIREKLGSSSSAQRAAE